MYRPAVVTGSAAVFVLLGGCGGGSSTTPSVEEESSKAAPGAGEANGQRASDEPEGLQGTSVCRGIAGDGKGNELTSVVLTAEGEDLRATFKTARPVPEKGTVLYSISAWDPQEENGYQLGVKFLDGQQIAHFIFSFQDAQQTNFDEPALIEGKAITAEFPMEGLSEMATPFNWAATLNIRGDDVDSCPAPGNDPLNPNEESFPP